VASVKSVCVVVIDLIEVWKQKEVLVAWLDKQTTMVALDWHFLLFAWEQTMQVGGILELQTLFYRIV